MAWFRSIISLVACLGAVCSAEIINAEADASYASKVHAGISQALLWMSDMATGGAKPPRPPRKVKLALVGFGRTGSTSFSVALKELDYAPVHDDEMTEVSDVYRAWFAGTLSVDEVNVELGKRGFDAPMVSVHEYVQWAAQAPGVKVILTVRDRKKWAESWLCITPCAWICDLRPFRWLKVMRDMSAFNREIMVNVPTNGRPELYDDGPTLEAGYDAWVDFVRKTVPKERLLEFNVKQGWGPLCEFLGVPAPSTPFPHLNDRVIVDIVIKVFLLVTWIWPLVFASPLLLLWCCLRCCCHRRPVNSSKKRQ